MDLELIDYTQLYYTAIAKTEIPPLVAGKFVQLRNGSKEYLVLSPKEFTKYHANIVERFCLDSVLEGSYDAERKQYAIDDQAWNIVGGGKYEINTTKQTINFFDNSMAYGKFDLRGLREKILSIPRYSGYAVEFDSPDS
jgi:hypothetical protein